MTPSRDVDRLYSLLPGLYRSRDAEQGFPLRALLGLITREADIVEADLAELYDSMFIETCPDWVVPYIGDLVGYAGAPEAGDPSNMDLADPVTSLRVLLPRRDVANTVHDRRRKGTLSLLEQIARDAAGWPACAVEFFRGLAWAQHLAFQHRRRGGTADLRDGRACAQVDGPFDRFAHTVDVRRTTSALTAGRYNIPSIGLFAWRLRAYTVSHCQADCVEQVGPHCYTFSVLGNDTPLFNRPRPSDAGVPPGRAQLPAEITRRMFEDPHGVGPDAVVRSIASADYYGLDRSVAVWAPDWPTRGAPQPVPREHIVPADLTGWKYQAPRGYLAVDPVLGRLVFPARQQPKGSVYVSYAYGFAAPIGGGEYDRPLLESPGALVFRVAHDRPGAEASIRAALQRWREMTPRPRDAVIEIVDSGVYTEPLAVELGADESLQLRAASGARPVIRLLDYMIDRADPFLVRGRRGSRMVLDGLLITGRGVAVQGPDPQEAGDEAGGDLCEIVIRHCTLVPGWGLRGDCEPVRPAEPSLEILGSTARVRIDHSILGSILVSEDQVAAEPITIDIRDSVLDATGHDCDRPECEALNAPGGLAAHAVASVRRTTVFGRIHTHAIALAENSLFMGRVRVVRRQVGCVRFCYLRDGSRTPPRYHCQPDGAIVGLAADAAALEAVRVRPQFMSTRYGTPDYARLQDDCAEEIRLGADDRSEMGVFHDLFQPQREALLRQRLSEFTVSGMQAGLIFTR
jgi:hypothetical protein